MLNIKPVRYGARLPATPCNEDMRGEMVAIAQREGVTLAELQRFIIQSFLNTYGSEPNTESEPIFSYSLTPKGEKALAGETV